MGLSRLNVVPSPLVLYPTGVGEMKQLKNDGLNHMNGAAFLPDGKRFVFLGSEPGHGARLYVESLDDGKAQAFSMEGVGSPVMSPDGQSVAARGPDQKVYLFPVAGGEPKSAAGGGTGRVPDGMVFRWPFAVCDDAGADPGSGFSCRRGHGAENFLEIVRARGLSGDRHDSRSAGFGGQQVLRLRVQPDVVGFVSGAGVEVERDRQAFSDPVRQVSGSSCGIF